MIRIGRLEVQLEAREVRVNGQPVRLGSRAFDVLEVLIEADGALVSKDQLLSRVWPDTVVEENNLQVHISVLRRVFGDERERIRTVPGRGYRLILPAPDAPAPARANEAASALPAHPARAPRHGLPTHTAPLIGREDAVAELLCALSSSRCVTLVGTGGIGKTRIAVELAHSALPHFPDGVVFVPFAPVSDTQSALDALANAMRSKPAAGRVLLQQIAREWRDRCALIVLDNCEQVLEIAAEIAEALSAASSRIRVLATSRETLRIGDERVYPVPPLTVPSEQDSSGEVLHASAVRFFLSRARAVDAHFTLDERGIFQTGLVCRQLDGIPLALELAAARAAVLGVDVLAANLDDRFRILTGGHRTALPRHQTLKATLDWSYRLLEETERKVLRWLSMFVNGFTFDAAVQMMADAGLNDSQVVDAVGGLVSKSLLASERDGPACRYRLLETTRAYALQKLDDNGERPAAASAHATFFHRVFDQAQKQWAARPVQDWLADFRHELDNLRSALDWTMTGYGNPLVGVELAAVAVPYLFDLSLVQECCDRSSAALRLIDHDDLSRSVSLDTRLRLVSALAAGLVYTEGPSRATLDAWREVLQRALEAGHADYESRALWGLWNWHQYGGMAGDALRWARRFGTVARRTGSATQIVIAGRIEGIALHYAGDQRGARARLEWMLNEYRQPQHRWNAIGFRIEHSIVAQATLARVLWVQQQHDEAFALATRTFEAARRYDHEMVTCYVLVEALIPIALSIGNYPAAEHGLIVLKQQSARFGFAIWLAAGACYKACLKAATQRDAAALDEFQRSLEALRASGFLAPLAGLLCHYATALAKHGRLHEALASVDEGLRHGDDTGERWCDAWLYRTKAEVLHAMGKPVDAQSWFARARARRLLDSATTDEYHTPIGA